MRHKDCIVTPTQYGQQVYRAEYCKKSNCYEVLKDGKGFIGLVESIKEFEDLAQKDVVEFITAKTVEGLSKP